MPRRSQDQCGRRCSSGTRRHGRGATGHPPCPIPIISAHSPFHSILRQATPLFLALLYQPSHPSMTPATGNSPFSITIISTLSPFHSTLRQATAASAFSQRMQRDQRFKKTGSGAAVNADSHSSTAVGFVLTDNDHQAVDVAAAEAPGQGLGHSSSSRISRSPLAPVHHNSLSPSRIPQLVDKSNSPKRVNGNGNGSSPKPETSPNRSTAGC